jgi:hypothetical protein
VKVDDGGFEDESYCCCDDGEIAPVDVEADDDAGVPVGSVGPPVWVAAAVLLKLVVPVAVAVAGNIDVVKSFWPDR